jgi:hypothetical protein
MIAFDQGEYTALVWRALKLKHLQATKLLNAHLTENWVLYPHLHMQIVNELYNVRYFFIIIASLLCRFMEYKMLRPNPNLRLSIGHKFQNVQTWKPQAWISSSMSQIIG